MSQTFQMIPPSLLEAIGVVGFGLYVLNYTMLTMHHLTSHSKTYFIINIVAASCVLIGLIHSFNLASALIQGFWIVISFTAIFVRLRPSKDASLA
ncbi:hypothetical protein L0664_15335 [Octadecabacter sp. G9-8]|uniref:CBU-0592-like domain-containing protein n=1 Tax=Octadecabacter dasysiphoniae TaxID=2909341 RepID=A0ABS9CZF8_9RHOB|nr:hypothetical protein [Octadecabacter dasysiphoniae]MCF2872447.1 hypothetical protein [Octadecabacter dasysiphoniae]